MNSADYLCHRTEYPNFPEFERHGIDLSLSHARTILELQAIRNLGGFPIYPGGYQDNWGRRHGSSTSEHYAVGRLATAGDVFPVRGHALEFWWLALKRPRIGGLGLYADTDGLDGSPWVMVHFDLRDRPRLLWVRDYHSYYYLHDDPRGFWRAFKKIIDLDIQD